MFQTRLLCTIRRRRRHAIFIALSEARSISIIFLYHKLVTRFYREIVYLIIRLGTERYAQIEFKNDYLPPEEKCFKIFVLNEKTPHGSRTQKTLGIKRDEFAKISGARKCFARAQHKWFTVFSLFRDPFVMGTRSFERAEND